MAERINISKLVTDTRKDYRESVSRDMSPDASFRHWLEISIFHFLGAFPEKLDPTLKREKTADSESPEGDYNVEIDLKINGVEIPFSALIKRFCNHHDRCLDEGVRAIIPAAHSKLVDQICELSQNIGTDVKRRIEAASLGDEAEQPALHAQQSIVVECERLLEDTGAFYKEGRDEFQPLIGLICDYRHAVGKRGPRIPGREES